MLDKTLSISITMQCLLLGLSRSTAYYKKKETSQNDLSLMEKIDKIHMKYPFLGSRRIRDELELLGLFPNRKLIQRLMRLMGIVAIYPRKRTSQPGEGHKIYPYLLRGLLIDRPGQVYAADVTYIPMSRGFLYLVAVIDWYSRRVLSWRLSNTLESDFCVEALEEAIAVYGPPEIFNTDQGAQFTSSAFTEVVERNGVKISMDGKGRWLDNVFVERLWRSLKYEEVYLKAYENPEQARREIGTYFEYFNTRRRHQSLGRRTPDTVFFDESLDTRAA